MSNVMTCYVLLEKSEIDTKVIGIYNYTKAIQKREELVARMGLNKYEIQGPFDIETVNRDINPFDFPSGHPEFPVVESPKLKDPFRF